MIIKDKAQLKEKLAKAGYKNIKDVSGTRVNVLIKSKDRVGALIDIAKKLKGAYNEKASGSSIGRTEINSKWTIYVKTEGSGGSGAGAEATRLTESAQCVYCACKWNKKPYTQANLKAAAAQAPTDEKIKNILEKLDDDWIKSCSLVADKLYSKYNSKNYHFHRGDSWVDKLENHWKTLNKKEQKFSNLNKWSPADIYMTTQVGRQIDITKTNNILELNELLLKAYKTKDIIGVSLKKVGSSVNFVEKNITSERVKYKYKEYVTGKRGFFLSNDSYIFYDGGEIQFRRFGTTWQGEIKGKFANMGKISGGPIATLLKDEFKIDFIPQRDIVEKTNKNLKLFYSFYKDVETRPLSYKKFLEEVEKLDLNWYISKILSTQMMSIVKNMSTAKRNQLVSSLLNYAGSESALSAPYVKVY